MLKKQAARLLGIKQSTIALYADAGLLRTTTPGKGHNRQYTPRNLVEILLIKAMVANGLTHMRIKQILLWVNGACSSAPPEACPDSIGYDALDPFDSMTLDRYTFLIIYDDELNFDLLWRENVEDTEKLPVNMKFQTAKVLSLRPLTDKVRSLFSEYYGGTDKV